MSDSQNGALSQERALDAAEYVLGTLDSDASKRLERELPDDGALRAEVDYWQDRLGALGLALAPVEPPAEVWQAIAERLGLGLDEIGTRRASRHGGRRTKTPATSRSRFWPGLAIAASIVAVVLAAVLFNSGVYEQTRTAPQPAYASVVYDKDTGNSWLVTAPEDPQQLVVTAMGRYPLPEGKVMRAWLKPADEAPIYIGTWPYKAGKHRLKLPPDAAKDITQKPSQLMVTMEDASVPASSSPNGPLLWASPVGRQHTG